MPTTPALSLSDFRMKVEFLRPRDVDLFEKDYPGAILEFLTEWTDYVYTRLDKRYDVPFDPVPPTVVRWVKDLTTQSVLNRRQYNPADPEMQRMQARYDQAIAEVKEAASSQDSLFGLPAGGGRRGDGTPDKAGPLAYSESSPFRSADIQEEIGRCEDAIALGGFFGDGVL